MRRASSALALLFACSGPARGSQAEPSPSERDGASAARVELPAPAPVPRPARRMEVRGVDGSARSSGSPEPLAKGAVLDADSELALERGATLTLALEEHVQLRLFGPLRARLLPEGEPALLLREGRVSVDAAPRAARSTESAFWLATADARIDVIESARMVIAADRKRASELAVVSGSVQLSVRGEPSELALAGGISCVGEAARPGFRELARAEEAVARTRGCKPRVDELLLAPLLDAIEVDRARERALLREHEAVLADADAATARRRELAELSRTLLLRRERARAVRSSLEASYAEPDDAQRALFARAKELAPYRF